MINSKFIDDNLRNTKKRKARKGKKVIGDISLLMTRTIRCSEGKEENVEIIQFVNPIRAALADKNACKWKTSGFGDVPKSNSTTPSSP